ncbi:hypothetical protein QQ045_001618 [Rhodiola kirilowii]
MHLRKEGEDESFIFDCLDDYVNENRQVQLKSSGSPFEESDIHDDQETPTELVELDLVLRDCVPVIKRFSGGGTVIVDGGTVFVTFICNKDDVPGLQQYPRHIMSWSSLVYNDQPS